MIASELNARIQFAVNTFKIGFGGVKLKTRLLMGKEESERERLL